MTGSAANAALPRFAAVGAGRMGRGIAIAFAYAGHRIALIDLRQRTPEAWAALRGEVETEIRASLQGLAQLGTLQPDQIDAVAARVQLVDAAGAPAALAAAELLFEGVPETMQAKREAFDWMNQYCDDNAILTSTTSSILVTQLAGLVKRPERFLNMHWLNPAYIIPVVELSTHPALAPEVLARTKALMESIGKLPVVCGPTPGYIVPRLQALIMNEAARMVDEGVATAEEIDKATRFGMGLRFAAIGVVEFIDFGGADILHHASREMAQSIDAARYTAPPVVGRMFEEGRLGLKTASGFYDYAGRDLPAYRHDVLARVLALLKHAGLWRAAADETLP
jgi:3-hydroxybutyryl-CoA dehydrogenase